MANAEHKLKLLYMLQIFYDHTDNDHPISMTELRDRLEQKLGSRPDRKSIYDDLAALTRFGVQIHHDPAGKKYYLEERAFSFNEVRTIVDCIAASKFLSDRQSRLLIDKCRQFCITQQRDKLMRQVIVQNRSHTENDEARDESEKIFEALQQKKQISFSYFDYDLNKKRRYRYGGDIICVSPWAMVYNNDFYYLLAFDGKMMKNYRVDHMEGVEVEKEAVLGEEVFKKINIRDYSKQTFGMFGGEVKSVTMCLNTRMIGTVLDRFGKDTVLTKAGPDHFRVTVPVIVSPAFYGWVFGLNDFITIESPADVRQGMMDMLASVGSRYTE